MNPLGDESGFSLVEMLVTMIISLGALLGAFVLIDQGSRATANIQDRTQVVQQGRGILEQTIQVLRSQVCFGLNQPSITQGDDTSVTFYADLEDDQFSPERYRFRLVGNELWEDKWTGTQVGNAWTYAVNPSSTRLLSDDIELIPGKPLFDYYAFAPTDPVEPTLRLPVPLTTGPGSDAARAVQINIAFRVRAEDAGSTAGTATAFAGQTFVRTADPLNPNNSPQCI